MPRIATSWVGRMYEACAQKPEQRSDPWKRALERALHVLQEHVHGVGAPRSTTRRTRAGPEGESDEMVQIAQIEWLVQITGGPRDQRLGLLPGCPGRRSS